MKYLPVRDALYSLYIFIINISVVCYSMLYFNNSIFVSSHSSFLSTSLQPLHYAWTARIATINGCFSYRNSVNGSFLKSLNSLSCVFLTMFKEFVQL